MEIKEKMTEEEQKQLQQHFQKQQLNEKQYKNNQLPLKPFSYINFMSKSIPPNLAKMFQNSSVQQLNKDQLRNSK